MPIHVRDMNPLLRSDSLPTHHCHATTQQRGQRDDKRGAPSHNSPTGRASKYCLSAQ
jgi:hypothetical protein